jgi:hypothetical protein
MDINWLFLHKEGHPLLSKGKKLMNHNIIKLKGEDAAHLLPRTNKSKRKKI